MSKRVVIKNNVYVKIGEGNTPFEIPEDMDVFDVEALLEEAVQQGDEETAEAAKEWLRQYDEEEQEEDLRDRPPIEEELYESYVIRDAREGGYVLMYEGRELMSSPEFDELVRAANAEIGRYIYYNPGLFYVNNRGNIDALDEEGNVVSSWV